MRIINRMFWLGNCSDCLFHPILLVLSHITEFIPGVLQFEDYGGLWHNIYYGVHALFPSYHLLCGVYMDHIRETDLILSLLRFNPRDRLTARQALDRLPYLNY
jgi:hypothetical protein